MSWKWPTIALVFYSVGALFLEMDLGGEHSLEGNPFWLWSERVVAGIFTIELFLRWFKFGEDPSTNDTKQYLTSAKGVIDLISVLPFWIGFICPVGWLGLIRAMRILRLLKLYRYSKSLQAFVDAMLIAKDKLLGLGMIVVIMVLFSSVGIRELEHTANESFSTMASCFWWTIVTMTTVGYGDMSPTTHAGQAFAVLVMLMGIGIMAAFIGIVGSTVIDKLDEIKSN